MTKAKYLKWLAPILLAGGALLLLAYCEPTKPVLVTRHLFGDDNGTGHVHLDLGVYRQWYFEVTSAMLLYNDQKANFNLNVDEDNHNNGLDFFIFDEDNLKIWEHGGQYTALAEQIGGSGATLWYSVDAPGSYYVVVSAQHADGAREITGRIYVTYWGL